MHAIGAARENGATNVEADKADRYPPHRSPYKATPLAVETYGRHGRAALRYLRKLARGQAARLDEDGDGATGALVSHWGKWLSVALHRAKLVPGAPHFSSDWAQRSSESLLWCLALQTFHLLAFAP